jgi:hypothetical protein
VVTNASLALLQLDSLKPFTPIIFTSPSLCTQNTVGCGGVITACAAIGATPKPAIATAKVTALRTNLFLSIVVIINSHFKKLKQTKNHSIDP